MKDILNGLPPVVPFSWSDDGCLLIVAMGFEDRATTVMMKILEQGRSPAAIILIDYNPSTGKNRRLEFQKVVQKFGNIPVHVVKYNRADPESLHQALPNVLGALTGRLQRILVDISAMSKMLILTILHRLKEFQGAVEVVYTEALDYGPTRAELEVERQNQSEPIDDFFVSTGIMNIATTSGFSSTAMPGCPHALIAFSGFNRNQLSTLYNELAPQYFYLVESVAHVESHAWRRNECTQLNQELFPPSVSIQYRGSISTVDYRDTIHLLEDLYKPVEYTHRFVVSPTGSKMQAVGIFLFWCVHPDIQIVYPTPIEYHSAYSIGVRTVWSVTYTKFSETLAALGTIRYGDLMKIREFFSRQDSGLGEE